MRIKSIQQTRNPEKLDLMFDDGSKLRVMATVVPDLGLYASMEVDAALLERILQTHEKAQTRLRAVRIVAAANVSQRELQRRLIQKGQKPEDAAEAAPVAGSARRAGRRKNRASAGTAGRSQRIRKGPYSTGAATKRDSQGSLGTGTCRAAGTGRRH